MMMTLRNNTGVTFMHDRNYPSAAESFRKAVEPNRTLIRLEPKNRRWEKEMATTLLNLGSLLQLQKDYALAEPYIREALALRQRAADWDPKSARALRKLAHAWHRLAQLQFDTGKNSDALTSARSSLDVFHHLVNIDPGDLEAIREIQEYAEKYWERLVAAGQSSDARELIQETLAFAEANRRVKTARAAWDKLLATLRAATTTPEGKQAEKP
jgi:tetratricopeptide (TPR) repeat protein